MCILSLNVLLILLCLLTLFRWGQSHNGPPQIIDHMSGIFYRRCLFFTFPGLASQAIKKIIFWATGYFSWLFYTLASHYDSRSKESGQKQGKYFFSKWMIFCDILLVLAFKEQEMKKLWPNFFSGGGRPIWTKPILEGWNSVKNC